MNLKDRIKELRRVRASELKPNPKNWRTHPKAQRDALRSMLAEIGYVDALIARELPDGTLEVVDGHLRAETTPDAMVPVLVTDLDQEEADRVLITLDPLAAMAEADTERLTNLLREVQFDNEAVSKMVSELTKTSDVVLASDSSVDSPTELAPIETAPPPKMAWVLVGIPTVRFGEIAADVERLSLIEGTIVETQVNDGDDNKT